MSNGMNGTAYRTNQLDCGMKCLVDGRCRAYTDHVRCAHRNAKMYWVIRNNPDYRDSGGCKCNDLKSPKMCTTMLLVDIACYSIPNVCTVCPVHLLSVYFFSVSIPTILYKMARGPRDLNFWNPQQWGYPSTFVLQD